MYSVTYYNVECEPLIRCRVNCCVTFLHYCGRRQCVPVAPTKASVRSKASQSRMQFIAGPECVLRCARGRRPLPCQKYACCLAMDGVGVLITGFSPQEKASAVQASVGVEALL